MFTGIVQAVGTMASLSEGVLRLWSPSDFAPEGFDVGESIAVNGCCLTVTREEGALRFDLSPETLDRTNLGSLRQGSRVNLERAMSMADRFGGHVVQGHVDATGTVASVRPVENSVVFRFQAPSLFDRYLIDKGSVTVDGISLTVVEPVDGAFDVWVIPHTLDVTNLGERVAGDLVNLEFDVMAKYVEKLMGSKFAGQRSA